MNEEVARTHVDDDVDRTPMQRAHADLDATVSTLRDTVTALRDQLERVMGPERVLLTDTAAELKVARETPSAYVESLCSTRANVESVISQVEGLRARLEV